MDKTKTSKKAKQFFNKAKDKAVKAMDKNDDGKFDSSDISIMKNAVNSATSKAAESAKKHIDNFKKERELERLQPIFLEDIDNEDFVMPRFIHVCDMDKAHCQSELCKDSIAHYSGQYDEQVLAIYTDKVSEFGIELYPDSFGGFYYMDPCNRSRYLNLENYFAYLKAKRLTELQKIAQDLGAKYFRITYREKKSSFSKSTIKGNISGKVSPYGNAKIDGSRDNQEDEFVSTNIEAENTFPGSDPIKPNIKYLKRDPVVKNLIEMRLNNTSPLGKQKVSIEFQNSSGMKEQDAFKIDAYIKGIKATGNMSVSHEVQNEKRRIFEYEIEF